MNILSQIDWEKVTKIDELVFSSSSTNKFNQNKFKTIISELKNLFFFRPNIEKAEKTETDFLFLKSLNRSDYNDLFDIIYSTCKSRKEKVDFRYVSAGRIRIFPLLIFVKNIMVYKHALRPSFLLTILLVIKITKYLEIYERVKNYQNKVLVVFADMQAIDNMMVQIANKKGVRTITLQHGLYVDYKDFPTENSTNYLNTVAHTFLAWGENTAALIKKYHPTIVTEVVGKPEELKETIEKRSFFTIVFDSNYFVEHNVELLKIAYELCDVLDLKVQIQFHPYNRKTSVSIDEEKTVKNKDIMGSQFILGHTTTMLYDCMIAGIPSFRYKTDKPSINTPDKLEFCDVQGCIDILKNEEVMSLDFNDLGRHYFKYVAEESKSKYVEFFSSLASNIEK